MPKYTSQPQNYPDHEEVPFYPCYLVDANGDVIDNKYAINVDTDTGLLLSMMRDADGDGGWAWESECAILKGSSVHPAPIRLINQDEYDSLTVDTPVLVEAR